MICLPPIVHEWIYDGERFEEQPPSDPEHPDLGSRRKVGATGGRFHAIAVVRFYIAPDRKKVAMNCVFGPLYGLGYVLKDQGQGATGRLVPDTEANGWMA